MSYAAAGPSSHLAHGGDAQNERRRGGQCRERPDDHSRRQPGGACRRSLRRRRRRGRRACRLSQRDRRAAQDKDKDRRHPAAKAAPICTGRHFRVRRGYRPTSGLGRDAQKPHRGGSGHDVWAKPIGRTGFHPSLPRRGFRGERRRRWDTFFAGSRNWGEDPLGGWSCSAVRDCLPP